MATKLFNSSEWLPLKVQLDDGAITPTRAHRTDAGLDLYSRDTITIPPSGKYDILWDENEVCQGVKRKQNAANFDTGVHVEIPHNHFGKIESKSGLNVNHSVVCCGGVIDEGYTGSIVVRLYNLGAEPYTVNAGDKIAQLVIMPCVCPGIRIVDSIEQGTERGDDGFGSTGK